MSLKSEHEYASVQVSKRCRNELKKRRKILRYNKQGKPIFETFEDLFHRVGLI